MQRDAKQSENSQIRKVILIGSLLGIGFCCGCNYAWSVFSKPLSEIRSWSYGSVSFAYSLFMIMHTVLGVLSGKILNQFGPAKTILLGGSAWALGWILTGFAPNLPLLYISFGLLAAFGAGFLYHAALSTAIRFFPQRKGLISGLFTGSAGIASLIAAPLSSYWLHKYNVLSAFRLMGMIFFCLTIIAVIAALKAPAPESGIDPTEKNTSVWKRIIRRKEFRYVWFGYFGGAVAGIMLIGHASSIGIEMMHISEWYASIFVGITAIANCSGRIVMGVLSDRIGPFRTIKISSLLTILTIAILFVGKGNVIFVIAVFLLCMCFGGVLAVFPSVSAETFGLKSHSLCYPLVFTAYGVAGVVGPTIASFLSEKYGSFIYAFIVAAVCALISFVMISVLQRIKEKGSTENV